MLQFQVRTLAGQLRQPRSEGEEAREQTGECALCRAADGGGHVTRLKQQAEDMRRRFEHDLAVLQREKSTLEQQLADTRRRGPPTDPRGPSGVMGLQQQLGEIQGRIGRAREVEAEVVKAEAQAKEVQVARLAREMKTTSAHLGLERDGRENQRRILIEQNDLIDELDVELRKEKSAREAAEAKLVELETIMRLSMGKKDSDDERSRKDVRSSVVVVREADRSAITSELRMAQETLVLDSVHSTSSSDSPIIQDLSLRAAEAEVERRSNAVLIEVLSSRVQELEEMLDRSNRGQQTISH